MTATDYDQDWQQWLTDEERREVDALSAPSNLVTLADLKIRTKGNATQPPQILPFILNESQRLYLDALSPNWQSTPTWFLDLQGCREDILKARQQGFSTLILAILFLRAINRQNWRGMIMADDAEKAKYLFEIVQRYYDNLPPEKKPPTKYRNRNELYFADRDSALIIGTVGNTTSGRSMTLNDVHMSERAFWSEKVSDPRSIEIGLLEAVPSSGCVWRETTANGYNDYYQERQAEHRGDSRFHPRFYGWTLHKEYRLNAGMSGFTPIGDEVRLSNVYGLDDGQLLWRRAKLLDLKEKFPQEYPINEAEAFISSGNPFFDRELLSALNDKLQASEYDPLTEIVFDRGMHNLLRSEFLLECLDLWEMPQPEDKYILAADPSGGLDADGRRDYCSADVVNVRTHKQVAHLHGQWDPYAFGLLLAQLAEFYNRALLGVHRNNHGHAVIDAIRRTARYPDQLGRSVTGVYHFRPSDVDGDKSEDNPLNILPGYPENTKTKPFMLDTLAEKLPDMKIMSRRTVQELLTYVHFPGGKSGAESGAHDDAVSSLALAAVLLKLFYRRERPALVQKPEFRHTRRR